MTPAEFVIYLAAEADFAAQGTKLDRWAILTQWADETGMGSSYHFVTGHNPAGMSTRHVDGTYTVNHYSTLAAGVADYVAYLHNGNYGAVLATAGQPVETQLLALGASPWAGGHYGNPPGSDLVSLWRSTLAPIAGPPHVPPLQPSSPGVVLGPLYVSLVQLAHELGWTVPLVPWGPAVVDHLGNPPTIAAGLAWLTAQLVALREYVAAVKV